MAFEFPGRRYDEDCVNYSHHASEEPLLPYSNTPLCNSIFSVDETRDIGYENALFDLQPEGNFRENSYTSDDVFDDDLSLMNASAGMYDVASWLKFDNCMEDLRETRDNMFSQYDNLMAYGRKFELELEDDIMKEQIIRSRSNLNQIDPMKSGCSRLYCPGGAVLVMPNGDIHVTPSGQVVPTIDVRVPNPPPMWGSQRHTTMDQSLKRQWCSSRNSSGYHTPDQRSRRGSSVHNSSMEKQQCWGSPMDCQIPNHPNDDELSPLMEKILIKVRNVHPTACLHELHVQRRELFPKKPIFNTTRFAAGAQKKRKFAVVCNFEFNGAKLYTYHMEQTKSDAKMNAARAMLRKLKEIPNLSILLDDVRIKAGAYASFEHPRCQLLHLHDTNPEMYPSSPTFEASVWRTTSRSRNKNRCINMTCHFQVGREKFATIGAANNKKQAVVHAARNMLKKIFPNQANAEDTQTGMELAASERKKTPWTCHFCEIFMTGRKPFLSHLTGRSHIQKMSELELNAEKENKILLATADEAFKKKEEEKRNAVSKNCTERVGAQLQPQKSKGFFDTNNVMNTSSQDSQESDGTCKNASTSSSVQSEFETNYSST